MLSISVLIMASSLLTALQPQPPALAPSCRAEVAGNVMKTQIRFSDGYTVSAPWLIVSTEFTDPASGKMERRVSAVLDRVIESSGPEAYPVITAFDRPVLATFSGGSDDEIMYHASQAWCATVIQSRMAGQRSFTPSPHQRMRIAAVGKESRRGVPLA